MKTTIRYSTFETNSSSSHSLIIYDADSTDQLDDLDKYSGNVVDIVKLLKEYCRTPYYGWDGQYTNFEDKLLYLFESLCMIEVKNLEAVKKPDVWNKTTIKTTFTKNIQYLQSTLAEVGVKLIVPKIKFKWKDGFYSETIVGEPDLDLPEIDHVTCIPDEFVHALLNSKINLLSWLFSDKSQILCSSDGNNYMEEMREYSHDAYIKGN